MTVRAGLVLLALALAACGVRGSPTPAPPLLGATDMPPLVPQPYQQTSNQAVNNSFAQQLDGYVSQDEDEAFPQTLPEDRSIRAAAPQEVDAGEEEDGLLDPDGEVAD